MATPATQGKLKPGEATQLMLDAAQKLGFIHPGFLLPHARIRHLYKEDAGVGTACINTRGQITINPDWIASLTKEERAGIVAHELCHVLYGHHARQGARDNHLWNVAGDMVINSALTEDKISLPSNGCFLPHDYTGERQGEHVYEWLKKEEQGGNGRGPKRREPGTRAKAGEGCGVDPAPEDTEGGEDLEPGEGEPGEGGKPGEGEGPLTQDEIAELARQARAMMQLAGKGSSAVARLLAPRRPRQDWKRVLRHGVQLATSVKARDWQTYSKPNRRGGLTPDIILPGWTGTTPRIAIVLDVSGSMTPGMIAQVIAETRKILAQVQVRAFLVAHTDKVVWSGWVGERDDSKLKAATSFSGGTDFADAYETVKRAGKFQAMVHFTDCFVGHWPTPPARLVVGQLSPTGTGTTPPRGTETILCAFEEE